MSSYRRVSLLGGISLGGAALLGTRAKAADNLSHLDVLNQASHVSPPTVEAYIVHTPDLQRTELQFIQILQGENQNLELGRFEGDGLTGNRSISFVETFVDRAVIHWTASQFVSPALRSVETQSYTVAVGEIAAMRVRQENIKVPSQIPGGPISLMSMSDGLMSGPLMPARYAHQSELTGSQLSKSDGLACGPLKPARYRAAV